ncbi:MAG TPA: DUF6622 family protein [Burkholderiaceae bacterium]|jgi:hypothetical protein|nr:DUF6622 family protein [Burkholderiaceae bacterium]
MIIEILSHTPLWVFALLFGLIYLGFQQSKTRSVTMKRLVILPIAMLGLSFSGVWTTFGSGTLALACWTGAMVAGAALAQLLGSARNVSYSAETQTFKLPGSWLPLFLMMAIFFTKYAVGFSLAQNPGLLAVSSFVGVASAVYGFWSGIFFGRMINILNVHGKQALAQTLAA